MINNVINVLCKLSASETRDQHDKIQYDTIDYIYVCPKADEQPA